MKSTTKKAGIRRTVAAGLVALLLPSGAAGQGGPGTVAWYEKIGGFTPNFGTELGSNDRLGRSCAVIGDLDGDGVVDFLVGAPRDFLGSSDPGRVYVLLMNADASVKQFQQIGTASGIAGLEPYDGFGHGCATIGDVDGDGVTDVAVAAIFDDDGGNDVGALYIVFLNADGTTKGYQKISATTGGFGGALDPEDRFGGSIAPLGDFNGDGTPDIAVGAWRDDDGGSSAGAIWLLMLSPAGTVLFETKISATHGGFTGTLDVEDHFGSRLTNLGDLDGDGVIDLATGVEGDDDGGTNRGAVYVLFLDPAGTVAAHQKISSTTGGFGGVLSNDTRFGSAVARIGDLDGDGVDELAAGATFDDAAGTNAGSLWILFMNADGTVHDQLRITEGMNGFGGVLDADDNFGVSAGGLADLDGDGAPEIIVGALGDDDGGSNAGAVWVLSLRANGPPIAVDDFGSTFEDGSIVIDVLANDVDPDGDALSVVSVTQAAHGGVVVNGDGTVTYTRSAGFNGTDSFGYTLSDGTRLASASVDVTVLIDVDVEPGVTLGKNVDIRTGAKIKQGSSIGDRTVIKEDAVLGRDVYMENDVVFGARSRIGRDSFVRAHATVEDDVVAGKEVTIEAGAKVRQSAVLGRKSIIGPDAEVGADSVLAPEVQVDKLALLGPRVVVGPKSRIRREATIGRRSVLTYQVDIGERAVLGRRVNVLPFAVVPDDAVVPDLGIVF